MKTKSYTVKSHIDLFNRAKLFFMEVRLDNEQ